MSDTKGQPLLQTQKTVDENAKRCALSRRILSVLSIQMLSFLVFTAVTKYVTQVSDFLSTNSAAQPIFLASIGVALVVALFVLCARELSKKKIFGYILLVLHTLAFTYILGYLGRDNPLYMFQMILQFAVATFILNLYSCITKTDYTLYGAGLYVILATAVVFTSCYFAFSLTGDNLHDAINASIAVLIYALYVIFEIQLITSGKRYDIGENDHIIGSMLIYADVLYLGLLIIDLITNINDQTKHQATILPRQPIKLV